MKEAKVAAGLLKMHLQLLEARAPGDFAGAFSAMAKERADGVIIITSAMFYAERTRIAKLAAASRVPTIYSVSSAATCCFRVWRSQPPSVMRAASCLQVW